MRFIMRPRIRRGPASRFHPVNPASSCRVHTNLNRMFEPLCYVISSPVFHRWRHVADIRDKNFAGTLALWDLVFGTFHMPHMRCPATTALPTRKCLNG
jgi:sterol desaturase/sphingolipid hydroxylase (fatty acid hydroxylase superfamily)